MVGIAVLAMLTLVPALLSLLGDRVDWPLARRHRTKHTGERVHSGVTVYRGFWGRFTKGIMARPIVGVVLTVIILLAITAPAFMLKTGAAGQPETLPPGERQDAYQLLVDNFPAGMLSPVQIVVEAPRRPGARRSHRTAQRGHGGVRRFRGAVDGHLERGQGPGGSQRPPGGGPDSETGYERCARCAAT